MGFWALVNRAFGGRGIDHLVAGCGATLCLALTIFVCAQLPFATADLPIIVAPLGASAVLIFAIPASPLAQPWPVVGGNILSSIIGVTMFRCVPDMAWAAGLAVGAAIIAMSLCRCLHPPGGAAALTAVIGSQGVHAAGYSFAFAPVGINSIALVSLAMFFHRMSGHSYPHIPAPRPAAAAGFAMADIDAALAALPDDVDVNRDDLAAILADAAARAAARR
jgi:CBS domain-containing membrane protein